MQDTRFSPGNTFTATLQVDEGLVRRFADFSGDENPIHLKADAARVYGHPRAVAHGAILVALISRMIGMEAPGPGAVWMGQEIEWLQPVYVGDTVTLTLVVQQFSAAARVMHLDVLATNQGGQEVMRGRAKVKVGEKIAEDTRRVPSSSMTALVVGGSRGIGRAIALRLAADGYRVAIAWNTNAKAAAAVVDEIRSLGGNAEDIQCDAGDEASIETLVKSLGNGLGTPNIVVHAAWPKLSDTPVTELQSGELNRQLRIVNGAAALVRFCAPHMIEQKFGRFIFLGTSAMQSPPPSGWAAYLAAKHALWGLTRAMAQELGVHGITANMIAPSLTITDLTADVPLRMREVEARRNPMRRLAIPEDVAATAAFLAGSEAGFINGQLLGVNGGTA